MTDMIVSTVPPRVQYVADGIERSYGFPFPLLAATDLELWLDDQPSTITYSVSGLRQSAGGTILFAQAPPAGRRITLARRMAIKRETDFVEGGEFRARALNEELDRLTLMLQQVDEALRLTLRIPPAELAVDLTLPEKAARAGKFLSFDAAGRPQAGLFDPEGAVLAAEQTAIQAGLAQVAAAAAEAVRIQLQDMADIVQGLEAKIQHLSWMQRHQQAPVTAPSTPILAGLGPAAFTPNWASHKS